MSEQNIAGAAASWRPSSGATCTEIFRDWRDGADRRRPKLLLGGTSPADTGPRPSPFEAPLAAPHPFRPSGGCHHVERKIFGQLAHSSGHHYIPDQDGR